MPKRTHFPGFELAQRIMTSATRDFDELFNDALDGCDIDDPATGARPKRPNPDLCLDALMILRLVSSHDAAGAPEMLRRNPALDWKSRRYVASLRFDRAAEGVFFNEVSSGSGGTSRDNDLALASEMAQRIELNYGFSERLTWHDPATTLCLQPRDIQDAVEARLRTAEAEVASALTPHRDTLERIAQVLIDERELDETRLSGLLGGISSPSEDRH